MLSGIEYLYFFLPIATGYTASAFCKTTKDSGSNLKFRPPRWVFGVVWPILYLLLGYSWVLAQRDSYFNHVYYSLLTLFLVSWIIVYNCKDNKKGGVYIILASIVASLLCYTVGTQTSKLLLAPLIGWLIFALIMNSTEVQLEN